MTEILTRLEALRAAHLTEAAWHRERGNVEAAANYRLKAAGIALAIREITAIPIPTLS